MSIRTDSDSKVPGSARTGTATFQIPEGGTDTIVAALSETHPELPVFVYERLDPATRTPQTTWIGLRVAGEEIRAHGDDPFARLRGTLSEARSDGPDGAVLGLVSYPARGTDAAGPGSAPAATPSALFLSLVEYIRLDHTAGIGRVIRTGRATNDPDPGYFQTLDSCAWLCETATVAPATEPGTEPDEVALAWQAATPRSDFRRAVQQAKDRMAEADGFDGVVLSVQMRSTAASAPLESYRLLRRMNPSTCMFLVRTNEFSLWGATSLSMVEVADGRLVAETDGATRPVPDLAAGETFVWEPSAKEYQEYDVVASALREDLSPISVPDSLVFTREREQRTFFGLSHLFAEVQADLAGGLDAVDAVRALFPHSAAVGHPRTSALPVIDELEAVPRSLFSGMIGMFGVDGTANTASVTRSMWTTPEGSFTQAGAKIVSTSDADEEYDECVIKTLALRKSTLAPTGQPR